MHTCSAVMKSSLLCNNHRISANKRPAQIKDRARIIDRGSGGSEISRLCLNRRSGLLIELIVCTCTMYSAILTSCMHSVAMAGMRKKYTIDFKFHTMLLADDTTITAAANSSGYRQLLA